MKHLTILFVKITRGIRIVVSTGATGATGATGMTGMTGATGATGPTVGQNFVRRNLDANQGAGPGQAITIGPVIEIGGTAITNPSFQTIHLAPNQIYQASYAVSATPNPSSGGHISVGFLGVAGSSTVVDNVAIGEYASLTNTVVFSSNSVPGGNLQLVNNSLGTGLTGIRNVQVSVVKVA
ncbi:hypothetical protein OIN60_20535 [Paenibacillus sp. P96]|uniref:Collagen-like protein n=1 Tax=Paenibacillus zeirhizosphaerae TaxID=2987519 RepID=A0ABT9FWK2_9BACL|nr:hypothetical protein [Paenibacillus sp. P96]MDP4099112.1 hypothetical protein [Paenibacillus sp. P96]